MPVLASGNIGPLLPIPDDTEVPNLLDKHFIDSLKDPIEQVNA